MCGISGIIGKNENKVEKYFQKMINSMNHRGPDYSSKYSYKNVHMGHNRLSIIDTSDRGNQPFENSDGILSFNGEIYNYKKLKRKYLKDIEFNSTSDTEVLFHMLNVMGVEVAIKLLKGMFAFSYFDKRSSRLYLCRDKLGIKPLFWTENKDSVGWSSEIKGLLEVFNPEIDHLRTIFSYAAYPDAYRNQTLFKNISILEPGTFIEIDKHFKIITREYYSVLDDLDIDYYHELKSMSTSKIEKYFDNLLNESVQSMLMSDVPFGSFVSGGLDSNLITSIAKNYNNDLKLFSSNVIGQHSEIEYAKFLSKEIGLELFISNFDRADFFENFAKCTYHYEVPILCHPNSIPFSKISSLAMEQNVKPVLTGEGADELFLGYPMDIFWGKYSTLFQIPSKLISSIYNISPSLKKLLFPPKSLVPSISLQSLIELERDKFNEKALTRLSDFPKKEQSLLLRSLNAMTFHLHTLLHRNDRMGMMYSIESRFPFLDEKIVKFGINLPSSEKLKLTYKFNDRYHPFNQSKHIVRRIGKKYLSDKLNNRKKRGFPISPLDNVNVNRKLFNNGYLEEILNLSDRDKKKIISDNNSNLYRLLSIETFGRIFHLKENITDINNNFSKNINFN
jgi:asparagine synthase (glutamine-hydrolysing)